LAFVRIIPYHRSTGLDQDANLIKNVLTRCIAGCHNQPNAIYHGHYADSRTSRVQDDDKCTTFSHIRRDRRFPEPRLFSKRMDTAEQWSFSVRIVGSSGVCQLHLEVREGGKVHFQTCQLAADNLNSWVEYIDFTFLFQIRIGLLNFQRQIYNHSTNTAVIRFATSLFASSAEK